MKRYMICCMIAIVAIIAIYYVDNYTSINIFSKSNIETKIKTDGREIIFNGKPFEIHAMNLGSYTNGSDDKDYNINYNTYIEWFGLIKDLNINTIRLFNIESPEFYRALYDYNKNNNDPLYLIQGTDVGEVEKNESNSYYDKDTYSDIFENIRKMIDVVHGNRIIMLNKEFASGIYRFDVSKYTLGYIIGTEWNDATIEYTNQKYPNKNVFEGKYFYTMSDAKPFEAYLAEVMDTLVSYESKKYGEQRLVSIGSVPLTDPFTYDEIIADYFNKFTSFDVARIHNRDNFISGMFASFQVYSAYPDFFGSKMEMSYQQYLEKLYYHYETMPLVISEFGYSTARLTNLNPQNQTFGSGTYNEQDQGNEIVKSIETMKNIGIKNYILYEWLDEFDKSSWNTMYAVDTIRNHLWNNVLTYPQHFGLMTYDSYTNNNSKIIIDGKNDDWDLSNVVYEDDNYKLYMCYDTAYIYFSLEKKNGNISDDKIYIPIDLTPNSGSTKSDTGNLAMSENADFLIVIDGENNSKILVQDYYNPIRALYGKAVYLHDQYEKDNIPAKDSSNFEDIINIVAYQDLIKNNDAFQIENVVTTVNTGYLIHGTSNPNSEEFNSLSDYYIDGNHVELRLAYGLFNFSAPCFMEIHDDYYKHYGVEYISINKMHIGVGNENSNINMVTYKLKGWGRNLYKYEARLKKSYYILKDYLKGVN